MNDKKGWHKKVVYLKPYPDNYSKDLFQQAGVEIYQFERPIENENGMRS